MKQLSHNLYLVDHAEIVTITVEPIELNPALVLAAVDGHTLTNLNPGGGTPTFAFAVESGPGGY